MTKKTLILFTALGVIVSLNIVSHEFLTHCYTTTAESTGIAPLWTKHHTVQISDFGHVLVAFILTLFLFIAYDIPKRFLLLFLTFFIFSCEFIQVFIPSREARFSDVTAGISGIILAALIYSTYRFVIGTRRR